MNETKFVIRHNRMYIKERATYGLFNRTNLINHANEFYDLDVLKRYVEDELKLNLANVEIIKVETITTESVITL